MSILQYDPTKLVEEVHEAMVDQGYTPVNEDFEAPPSQEQTIEYEQGDNTIELNYLGRGGSVATIHNYDGDETDALEVLDNVVETSDELDRFRKEIQQAI